MTSINRDRRSSAVAVTWSPSCRPTPGARHTLGTRRSGGNSGRAGGRRWDRCGDAAAPAPRRRRARRPGRRRPGTCLLHRVAPAAIDLLAATCRWSSALSPLVGTPLTTSRQVRRRRQVAADRRAQRRPVVVALRASPASAPATTLIVGAGRGRTPRCLAVDDDGCAVEPAPELGGLTAPRRGGRARAARAAAGRPRPSVRPASARSAYATISHDNRHAGRGGLGRGPGAKNAQGRRRSGRRRGWASPTRPAWSAAAKDLSRRGSARRRRSTASWAPWPTC